MLRDKKVMKNYNLQDYKNILYSICY